MKSGIYNFLFEMAIYEIISKNRLSGNGSVSLESIAFKILKFYFPLTKSSDSLSDKIDIDIIDSINELNEKIFNVGFKIHTYEELLELNKIEVNKVEKQWANSIIEIFLKKIAHIYASKIENSLIINYSDSEASFNYSEQFVLVVENKIRNFYEIYSSFILDIATNKNERNDKLIDKSNGSYLNSKLVGSSKKYDKNLSNNQISSTYALSEDLKNENNAEAFRYPNETNVEPKGSSFLKIVFQYHDSKLIVRNSKEYVILSGSNIKGTISKEDLIFPSPSAAANYISNSKKNGWICWKSESGNPLDLYREEILRYYQK